MVLYSSKVRSIFTLSLDVDSQEVEDLGYIFCEELWHTLPVLIILGLT